MTPHAARSGILPRLARVLSLLGLLALAPASFGAQRTFVRSTGVDSKAIR